MSLSLETIARRGISLAEKRPDIGAQWHPTLNGDLTPYMVTAGSHEKAWWVCPDHSTHEWQAMICNRSAGNSCPICLGRSLAKLDPDLAAQWHPIKNGELTPEDVTQGSNEKAWWVCPDHSTHEWQAMICDRSKGKGCPICLGRSLAKVDPDLAAQWHPIKNGELTPEDVTVSSNQKAWWVCPDHSTHEWEAQISNRSAGNSCPICLGRSLAKVDPDLAAQWHPIKNGELNPEDVTVSSGQKAWWVCPDHSTHEWEATISNRSAGKGCPKCVAPRSKGEIAFCDKLINMGLNVEITVTTLTRGQTDVDMFLPDYNIAVEYNGVWWHKETKQRGKDYHYEKWSDCNDKDVQLIQVWSDQVESALRELLYRLDMPEKLALPSLPVYYSERIRAEEVDVIRLNKTTASELLTENLLLNIGKDAIYLGLQDVSGHLRAVLVLSHTSKSGELRIDRYETAGVVTGGINKLLSYAEQEYKPTQIIRFADRSVSEASFYEDNGFIFETPFEPDYSYLVKQWRVNKSHYAGLLPTDPQPYKIWDSGSDLYIRQNNCSQPFLMPTLKVA